MTANSSPEIHLVAALTAKPEQKEALFEALHAILPVVRQEPGCIRYDLHADRDNPLTAVMLESWADQAAFDGHIAAPSFQSLAVRLDALLAEPLKLQYLEKLG
jgi:quinol monooxygenase YgiN